MGFYRVVIIRTNLKDKMSLTITGLIVGVVVMIMKGANIEVAPEQITEFLNTAGLLVSGIMIYWGRIRKGDLKVWGGRKF